MAFENRNMSVIAYANGFTLWHYNTEDEIDKVLKDNYFEKIYTLSRTGDIIIINAKKDKNNFTCIKQVVLSEDKIEIKPLNG